MTIFLWALQIILALHTAIGAIWKLSNSEQAAYSLKIIPHSVWMALIAVELICSLGLIFPAFFKPFGILVPIAALCVSVEMLFFCGVHIYSGDTNYGPLLYWLIVAAICAFIAYGRFVLKPL